jgi:DNA-binding response OmpR family regulator
MSKPIAVLVVDDDSDSRTLLELALSGEGHHVLLATNGAEALVVARRARPDVILLDLAMPVMDGFAFRAAQLGEPALAAIPVICVSGRHDSVEAAHSLKLNACVTKPFAFEEIVARVRELAAAAGQQMRT